MRRRWGWTSVLVTVLIAGCGDTGPDTRRGCATLGWSCGIDDFGNSCGSCPAGQSCPLGTCRSTTTPTSCSCGGRACGVDPVCGTTNCGTCTSGRVCSAGACVNPAPSCTVAAWGTCTPGQQTCCLLLPRGIETLCTTYSSGASFCNPRCGADSDCDAYTGTTNTWRCLLRNDGQRVCAVR